jgi:hypothetical protein
MSAVSFKEKRSKVKESSHAAGAPEAELIPITQQAELEKTPAWEMIEPGRYQPRRVRGSFPGRELG